MRISLYFILSLFIFQSCSSGEEEKLVTVENNFSLLISIDGSKEKHNQNRVDIHNNPTYDTIMSNLSVFKQNYPHYNAGRGC